MTRGTNGTPVSQRACETRWASRAWTPAQPARISRVSTPRAAGSRSRAVVTSEVTSPTTRLSVLKPNILRRVRLLRREEGQRHVALAAVRDDHGHPLPGHLLAPGDLQRR